MNNSWIRHLEQIKESSKYGLTYKGSHKAGPSGPYGSTHIYKRVYSPKEWQTFEIKREDGWTLHIYHGNDDRIFFYVFKELDRCTPKVLGFNMINLNES
uniref:DUF1080 domain-containing protein n=1 Tax=Acrobeloides nanus TaxID=290746 RepID=A0A914C3L5_9BILA